MSLTIASPSLSVPRPNPSDRVGRTLFAALLTITGGLSSTQETAGAELDAVARARLSITRDELRDHVFLLADDTLEGREAGSRGGYAAGNYLVRHFQNHLEPAAGGGQYFQLFQNGYRNLLGVRPGHDPRLRDEYILIGAHYDHVGYGTPRNSNGPIGVIHNGADDNASGCSAILEIVQALGTTDLSTRRSILFALWDGEEKGLLGSEHWAKQPTIPLSQIRCVINTDMIGRLKGRPLEVLGTRSMPGLRSLVAQANYPNDLRLKFPWTIEENSDHYTFVTRQIPIVMFHSGLHDDYHRPTDDPEYVDTEGLEATTRLVFNTLTRLADADELGSYRVAARHETNDRQRDFERPLPPPAPRLGVSWDPSTDPDRPGLTLRVVAAGSAAERAGLRPGDQLVELAGTPLRDSLTLQQAAVVASQLQLTVLREDDPDPRGLTIKLNGKPSRIGISWRVTPAEPETVTVVRVLAHSVADQAGVRVGDRIHQLDGRLFADSREFYEMTQSVALPASVLLEREGRLRELTLPSLPPLGIATEPEPQTALDKELSRGSVRHGAAPSGREEEDRAA